MTPSASDPNFPPNLSISPSQNEHHALSTSASFSALSQASAIAKYGIAGRVWEAAYVMLLYLSGPPTSVFDPPFAGTEGELGTVLELGAGTGVVGLGLAERLAGAGRGSGEIGVVLTDLPEVCALLEENASGLGQAARAMVEVMPLAWGDAGHADEVVRRLSLGVGLEGKAQEPRRHLTHIICSDLVYFPELLAPLLRTLLYLTSLSAPRPPAIVIAYKVRSLAKETPFWSAFGLWFAFAPVLVASCAPSESAARSRWTRLGADADAFVFVARRRAESMAWDVPGDDEALMRGVGARGTDAPKNDDAFELLLLMAMGDREDEDEDEAEMP
ncbi:putative methyltransferase-domain-containing protein [Amylostereum chailletii]|nr:putative methyltransferase-domain-containing protein [Amylostereum chailletii]